jgi:hypothetical protein
MRIVGAVHEMVDDQSLLDFLLSGLVSRLGDASDSVLACQ